MEAAVFHEGWSTGKMQELLETPRNTEILGVQSIPSFSFFISASQEAS